jgi:hypothetical protein
LYRLHRLRLRFCSQHHFPTWPFIDDRETLVIAHGLPTANFVARTQAAEAEAGFAVEFANVDAG